MIYAHQASIFWEQHFPSLFVEPVPHVVAFRGGPQAYQSLSTPLATGLGSGKVHARLRKLHLGEAPAPLARGLGEDSA